MIKEHDRIVLTESVPAARLAVGDVGTVVHVYADGKAFEVEFTTLDGKTAPVATVEATAEHWSSQGSVDTVFPAPMSGLELLWADATEMAVPA